MAHNGRRPSGGRAVPGAGSARLELTAQLRHSTPAVMPTPPSPPERNETPFDEPPAPASYLAAQLAGAGSGRTTPTPWLATARIEPTKDRRLRTHLIWNVGSHPDLFVPVIRPSHSPRRYTSRSLPMNWLRRRSVPAFVVILSLTGLVLCGQRRPPPQGWTQNAATPESEWSFDRSLTLWPRPEPQPALQYQLFPLASAETPGRQRRADLPSRANFRAK